jgi:two-component system, NtrC family, sensor kinase
MRALMDYRKGRVRAALDRLGGIAPAAGASIVRSRLFIKYVILFVAVVGLALVANGAFDVYFSYQEQKTSLVRIQREQAEAAAGKIGQFVSEIERQVGWTTQLPWSAGTLEQRRFDALRLLRQVPAITELAEIDSAGHEQLKVSRLAMEVVGSGNDVSKDPAFIAAVAHKVYYGPVYFRRESEPYMTLSLAGTRRDTGVSIAQVNLKLIWDVLSKIKFAGHGRAYVVDAAGRLIAHPDISLVLRNTDMSQLAQVRSARAAVAGDTVEQVQEAEDNEGHRVLTASAPVAPLGWLVFVETPIQEAYAPLYAAMQRTGVVLLGALALAFAAAMFLARRMVVPIQALRSGAARLGSGDLGQRIAIKTGDELEALADQFNDMAGRLQESYANLEKKVELRTRELSDSLEQQTATSEVLQIINLSPGELEPVFETMLRNAVQICGAKFGNLWLREGDSVRIGATYGAPPAWSNFLSNERRSFRVDPRFGIGRLIRTKETYQVADITAEPTYDDELRMATMELSGARTLIGVPMLAEGEVIGSIVIYRQEVRPFDDKQIDLLKNFAAQAVIAIENTRLLTELRESLQQQTATAEVLGVISRSKFELQPILQSVVDTAARLCRAEQGVIFRLECGTYRFAAGHSVDPAYLEIERRTQLLPDEGTAVGRAVLHRKVARIDDAWTDPLYEKKEDAKIGGVRSMIGVPLMREGEPIGAIALARNRIEPFVDREIELVTTFADQAVIAIENVRLFEAEQQRTRELAESLEQQTATSEVLQVISSSPGDLQPVFETMLENGVRICDAAFGDIYRWEGGVGHLVASLKTPAAFAEARRRSPFRSGTAGIIGRMLATKAAVHVADLAKDQAYVEGSNPATVTAVELGSVRTILTVPMLKEDELIGSFTLYRQEVRPFTDKQIALVTSFAAQAVIAIENTRLLSELRQRTDELGRSVGELRALGEVSQAVNSTLDLETVLSTIVAKAVRLSGTEAGAIYVFDDGQREFHLRATYGMDQELIDALSNSHIGLDETNVAVAAGQQEPIQIADLKEEVPNAINEIILRAGYRARLTAPLFHGEDIVGLLVVRRKTPGEFARSTVDLIKTFAAQSVLAIQNARLFENVEIRTGQLTRSLEDLRTAQDRLVQTEKLASLGQLTAGIAHEIKNPLNFVNNFSAVSVELIDEMREALGGAQLDTKLRAEIEEIANMLQGNLDKVVQHGKRADSIVKNMLLHSRQGSGEHRPVDINALVDESLSLAYHGARAEKQGFNITLERSFDPAAGEVDLFPQEITRVLLNLISNGFYAATKRKAEANGGNYEPTLGAKTKDLGDSVEIKIRDNGTGIPPEVKERMFNPFFTTKPAGEGTGLGLSLSYDIIVKQHAGSIEVDTLPGEFTEFRVVLPRQAATIAKSGE